MNLLNIGVKDKFATSPSSPFLSSHFSLKAGWVSILASSLSGTLCEGAEMAVKPSERRFPGTSVRNQQP